MTVQLRTLRVTADMDPASYVSGMNQKIAADNAGAASSRAVGAAVTQTDQKVSAAGDALSRLSRQYIDGFASAQRFDSALQSLSKGIDTGNIPMAQADAILEGIYRKFGMTANAADLAANGHNQLAVAVSNLNAKMAAQETITDNVTAATARMGNASARAAAQRTNLIFQLQDIGVSLAGGMNPLMVAAQQGSQISTIYGPGEGGLGRAFKETGNIAVGLATKLGPIAAAVGAIGLAFAGLTHYINQTSDTAVSMGDVFMATLQVIGENIYTAFRPQIEAMGGWFQAAWDWISEGAAIFVDNLVRGIATGVENIRLVVAILPDLFIMAGEAAANGFVAAIEWMVNETGKNLNVLLDGLQPVVQAMALIPGMQSLSAWGQLNRFEPVSLDRFTFAADATQSYSDKMAEHQNILAEIMTTDYTGKIAERAEKLALARAEEAKATGGATQKAKEHKDQLTEDEKAYKKLAETIEGTLGKALGSLFDGPIDDASAFFDKVLSGFAQIGQQNISGLFDGVLGGKRAANDNGTSAGAGSTWDTLFGATKAGTEAGAKLGTLDGLDSLLKGAGVKGGTAGALSAGLGGLGVGYETQNPLMGGLGGALSGFAVGGPIGAVIGGIGGLIGGFLGMNEAAKKARKALDQQRDSIEQFIDAADGKEIGQYTQALRQFQKQSKEYQDLAKAAGDTGLVNRLKEAAKVFKVTLGEQFSADLRGSLNDLQGRGYINDAEAALAAYNARLSDAKKLGVSSAGAFTELTLSLRDVIEDADLTDAQVRALAAQFPDLAKGLNAALKASISLTKAQENVDKSRSDLSEAYDREKTRLEDLIDRNKAFIQSLTDLKSSLKLDAQLSPLSPFQKFLEAQKQFNAGSAAAAGGDQTAMGNLAGLSQSYLSAARDYFGSSDSYQQIFGSVQATLDKTIAGASKQVSIAELQLTKLDAQVAGLLNINTSVLSVAAAVKALEKNIAILNAAVATGALKTIEAVNENTAAVKKGNRESSAGSTKK